MSGGKETKRAKSKSVNSKEQVPSWLNQRKEKRVQWVRVFWVWKRKKIRVELKAT